MEPLAPERAMITAEFSSPIWLSAMLPVSSLAFPSFCMMLISIVSSRVSSRKRFKLLILIRLDEVLHSIFSFAEDFIDLDPGFFRDIFISDSETQGLSS